MSDIVLHVGDVAVAEGLPDEIDPEATYRVQLRDAVELAPGVVLSPGERQYMSGALVERHRDRIYGAVKEDAS